MSIYEILKDAHSAWRYVVIILLLIAFLTALTSYISKKEYTEGNKRLNVFALISTHIQLLLGLFLYFMNDWYKVDSSDAVNRYWKMEHVAIMVIAVILITIGNSKSKKAATAVLKHRSIFVFFGFALLLITVAILMMVKVDPSRALFGISQ
jgi:NADH:ubiquinone oxidoreductase subunit 6 (subunit J)